MIFMGIVKKVRRSESKAQTQVDLSKSGKLLCLSHFCENGLRRVLPSSLLYLEAEMICLVRMFCKLQNAS